MCIYFSYPKHLQFFPAKYQSPPESNPIAINGLLPKCNKTPSIQFSCIANKLPTLYVPHQRAKNFEQISVSIHLGSKVSVMFMEEVRNMRFALS